MSKKANFDFKIEYSNDQSGPKLNLQVSEGKETFFNSFKINRFLHVDFNRFRE